MRKICSSVILNFSRVLRPRKINREKVVNRRKAMKNGIIFCEGKSFLKPEMRLKNNDQNVR